MYDVKSFARMLKKRFKDCTKGECMRASKRDEERERRASLSNEMKSIRAFRECGWKQ